MKKEFDIIIPIALDNDRPTYDDVIKSILELYNKYGFKKFALSAPYGGWRAVGYPPAEFFKSCAELFLRIKKELMPYNIDCGWWIQTTLKSGHSERFTGYVKEDGTKSFFQNCPLDDAFIKRFSHDVALFAKIAKPKFIITEDDYTINPDVLLLFFFRGFVLIFLSVFQERLPKTLKCRCTFLWVQFIPHFLPFHYYLLPPKIGRILG